MYNYVQGNLFYFLVKKSLKIVTDLDTVLNTESEIKIQELFLNK